LHQIRVRVLGTLTVIAPKAELDNTEWVSMQKRSAPERTGVEADESNYINTEYSLSRSDGSARKTSIRASR